MKGYFFRLAQHTGLRLKPQSNAARPGGAIEPRPARAAEPRYAPTPLHREETVFVNAPPAENSAHVSPPVEDRHAPLPLNSRAVETSPRENNFSTGTAKASPARDSHRAGFERQENEGGRKSQDTSDASRVEARLQTQDARVLIEQPAATHETLHRQERAQTLSPSQSAAESAEERSSSTALEAQAERPVEARELLVRTEPEHFTETAALLDAGVTDRELLQKVFFREIHTWIAAPNESVAETRPEPPPARLENPERVSLIEPDAALAPTRPRAMEQERLEEHDLSLSIGSISIVIEEPPAQAQPPAIVQAQPRAESSRTHSTGEFSRLSRHYIR